MYHHRWRMPAELLDSAQVWQSQHPWHPPHKEMQQRPVISTRMEQYLRPQMSCKERPKEMLLLWRNNKDLPHIEIFTMFCADGAKSFKEIVSAWTAESWISAFIIPLLWELGSSAPGPRLLASSSIEPSTFTVAEVFCGPISAAACFSKPTAPFFSYTTAASTHSRILLQLFIPMLQADCNAICKAEACWVNAVWLVRAASQKTFSSTSAAKCPAASPVQSKNFSKPQKNAQTLWTLMPGLINHCQHDQIQPICGSIKVTGLFNMVTEPAIQ